MPQSDASEITKPSPSVPGDVRHTPAAAIKQPEANLMSEQMSDRNSAGDGDDDREGDRPGDTYVQSFARGLSVIRSFDSDRPAQTLSDVAAATGLTRSGARRFLLTLQRLGYVHADGRSFTLTPKILELGFTYLTSLPFWHLAEPVLEGLSAEVCESASAAVLDGTEIVYVLRVPMQKIMTINLSIGSRLPAYCSSMGRVLLSGLDDAALSARLDESQRIARTPKTIIEKQALMEEIALVRKQGWALVDQELEAGLISLSAPIRNRQGRIIAAMNISGNAQRKDSAAMIQAYLSPLRQAADTVSGLVAQRG